MSFTVKSQKTDNALSYSQAKTLRLAVICSFFTASLFLFFPFSSKAKRFPFAGFLHLLLLHDFSGILEKLEQKNILQTIKQLIHFSYLLLKRKIFWSIFFLKRVQQRKFLQRLTDKCRHLFICISLKHALDKTLPKVT